MAVDIGEPNRSEPGELRLDVQQLVRRILFIRVDAQTGEEAVVQASRGRCDMLEVQKRAARSQEPVRLFVERSLARVGQMVDPRRNVSGGDRA